MKLSEIVETNSAEDRLAEKVFEFSDSIHLNIIRRIVKNLWMSKYPNIPIFVKDNYDHVLITTDKTGQASFVRHSAGDHFVLAVAPLGDYGNEPVVGLQVQDASSGNFKGMVTEILAKLFEWVRKKFPELKPVLAIIDDQSGGTWQRIADKLQVKYENQTSHKF
jgi:hypothetical protein